MKNLSPDRLWRALADLSPARRLAAGAIVVVMIAATVWSLGGFAAGDAKLELVIDQSFTDADLAQIDKTLTEKSVPHAVRDGRVYAPAHRKLDVISEMFAAGALAASGTDENGFDTLVKQISAFDPPSKTDKMFNRAREITAERVIGRYNGVRKVTVLIDPSNDRRLGGPSVEPRAMVDIQTRGEGAGANPRQLSAASVNVLTGVMANLARDQVYVTIDGATFNAEADAKFAGGAAALERRQQIEQAHVAKVRKLLGYIPDVLVSVSVDAEPEAGEVGDANGGGANALSGSRIHADVNANANEQVAGVARADADSQVEANARADEKFQATAAPESAVVTNVVPAIGDAAAQGAASVTAPETFAASVASALGPAPAPAGARAPAIAAAAAAAAARREVVRSASVAVPRSYFVSVYLRANKKALEPDDALLQPIVDNYSARIRNLVKNALALEDADVSVEPYEDALPQPQSAASAAVVPGGPSAASSGAGLAPVTPSMLAKLAPSLNAYAKHIAFATFGGIALLLAVSVLLRRQSARAAAGTPVMANAGGGVMATRAGAHELINVTVDDVLKGVGGSHRAGGGGVGSAAGDDDEAEAHQLFRRVKDMVSEHPDDAARVVRSWIYQQD